MKGGGRDRRNNGENVRSFAKSSQGGKPPSPPGYTPKICKVFLHTVDTSRLLLAFLAFGAACTTLWAWMLATATTPAER